MVSDLNTPDTVFFSWLQLNCNTFWWWIWSEFILHTVSWSFWFCTDARHRGKCGSLRLIGRQQRRDVRNLQSLKPIRLLHDIASSSVDSNDLHNYHSRMFFFAERIWEKPGTAERHLMIPISPPQPLAHNTHTWKFILLLEGSRSLCAALLFNNFNMGAMKISTETHQSTEHEFGPMVPPIEQGVWRVNPGTHDCRWSWGIGNGESYFVHFIDAMLKAHGTLEYPQVFWVVNHTGRFGTASLVVTVRSMQIEHCIGTAFALDVQYTARSRDDFWPIAAATRTGCGCPSGTKRSIQGAKTSSVFDGLIHCQNAADRSLMHFVLLDSYAAPGCNWLKEFEKMVGNDYHGLGSCCFLSTFNKRIYKVYMQSTSIPGWECLGDRCKVLGPQSIAFACPFSHFYGRPW